MRTDDPYYDKKKYHMAHLFGPGGAVSPLCAGSKPRAIRYKRGETWTISAAVTCKKCLALMKTDSP